jgi:NADH:ubiquinone oxidoreductase subunit 6 (subunit J)
METQDMDQVTEFASLDWDFLMKCLIIVVYLGKIHVVFVFVQS